MNEFKEIPDFYGYYADLEGNIWSKKDFHGGLKTKAKKLKPYEDRDGYLRVALYKNGMRIDKLLSHLVLETFVGPRPKGCEACHFPDHNPSNNRPENLIWATHLENINQKTLQNRCAQGEKHGMSRLKEVDVKNIRKARKFNFLTYDKIGLRYGISASHACSICKGKYWKSV